MEAPVQGLGLMDDRYLNGEDRIQMEAVILSRFGGLSWGISSGPH